ncbi:MAG: class F sortase [Acidimicrobiia bacterium]|jgi:LPXTG-site transpeptidase (sortase) family protein
MRLALGLATLGIALGALAIFGFLSGPVDAGDVDAVQAALQSSATTTSTTEPVVETTLEPDPEPLFQASGETPLLADLRPDVGPTPVGLTIEKLGIDAPVGEYGVDNQGRMDVPDNITEVGWYKFGPSPGEDGSAVLAAHVDLAGPGKGLFYDLDELEPGDMVTVSYSDGVAADFEVFARSTYLKTELPLDTIFSRTGQPVLTLVTCGGGFSRSANSYDSNVVVYAVPVGSVTTTLPAS